MSITLIPLRDDELKRAGIPVKKNTLYQWRRKRKNLKIFTRVGGRVFVIKERWEEMVVKNTGKIR